MRPRQAPGLAGRLFLAQTLVAVLTAATVWLVAAAVGPPLFHRHLRQTAGVGAAATTHAEKAFTFANAISIGVALLVALTAALAISAYASRRIAGPVVRLADAAADVAAGHTSVRVPGAGLGGEFATLTGSFNAMAGRLEAVEATRRRLLGDLAHEMRTPVTTLDAYLEGIQDGVATVDPATIGMLRTQTARLTRLADDMAAVSRAEEGQLELHLTTASPARLARAAAAGARDRYADKGVILRLDLPPALPAIDADPDRIGQVLVNLLDNALRHTPAGGTVTVTARAERSGQTVALTVADTGVGIPGEHLPHVFERFYRVDRARDRAHGGSGIGLAIVRALVEAHGGSVTAASSGVGQGSMFTLTLPVSSAAE